MEIVHSARFDTPFGEMLAASTERGLAYIQLPRASGRGDQNGFSTKQIVRWQKPMRRLP